MKGRGDFKAAGLAQTCASNSWGGSWGEGGTFLSGGAESAVKKDQKYLKGMGGVAISEGHGYIRGWKKTGRFRGPNLV